MKPCNRLLCQLVGFHMRPCELAVATDPELDGALPEDGTDEANTSTPEATK